MLPNKLRIYALISLSLAFSVTWASAPALAIIIPSDQPAAARPPKQWPSAVQVRSAGGACSGTVVGRKTVLTSAHCVGETDPKVSIMIEGALAEAICERHPDHDQKSKKFANDVALCAVSPETEFQNHQIARVSTQYSLLQEGAQVVLVGFGCKLASGLDRNYGDLGAGMARILTSGGPAAGDGTFRVKGAALCQGDAGGGAFMDGPGGQTIVGVNNRGDTKEFSWIVPTGTDKFLNWARRWSQNHEAPICGVMNDEVGCGAGRPDEDARTLASYPVNADAPASVALAELVKAPIKEGDTVRTAVERLCGQVPDTYFATLAEHHRRTSNTEVAANMQLDGVGEIEVPACPNTPPPASIRGPAAVTLAELVKAPVKEGDTVRTAVERLCGRVPDTYFAVLAEHHRKTSNTEVAANTRLDGVGEIEVPACPISLPSVSKRVQPGDTVSAYYQQLKAASGKPGTEAEFVENFMLVNPRISDPAKIKSNEEVFLPVFASSSQPLVKTGPLKPEFAFSYAELQSSNIDCPRPDGAQPYPYDLIALLDAMKANIDSRANFHKTSRVKVVVADSGLYQGSFIDASIDDVFKPEMEPLQNIDKPSHGSQVASLILGGPLFARLNPILANQPIQLRPARLHQRVTASVTDSTSRSPNLEYTIIDDAGFQNALRDADTADAKIINLSMKSIERIGVIDHKYLSENKKILFVAAAGNQGKPLGTSETMFYPAVYANEGGETYAKVITVAAIDGSGKKLWTMSNHGPRYVDLAAPGCAIPVASFDTTSQRWIIEEMNGTSLAAPLVTFAAALVQSELRNPWPADVKSRLLVSANLDKSLETQIKDGRTLDIPRAISVYHDIVETVDGHRIRGDVAFVEGEKTKQNQEYIKFQCDGATGELWLKPHDIRKIVPQYDKNSHFPMKIYYREKHDTTTSLFLRANCAAPNGLKICIRKNKMNLHLSEIKDITMKDELAPPSQLRESEITQGCVLSEKHDNTQ